MPAEGQKAVFRKDFRGVVPSKFILPSSSTGCSSTFSDCNLIFSVCEDGADVDSGASTDSSACSNVQKTIVNKCTNFYFFFQRLTSLINRCYRGSFSF